MVASEYYARAAGMKHIGSMSALQYSQMQGLHGDAFGDHLRKLYDQFGGINRVMRNPPEPEPDSSRTIKEKCLALMDETWGKIEEPIGSPYASFGITGYTTASATGYASSAVYSQGLLDTLTITDPYSISYTTKP